MRVACLLVGILVVAGFGCDDGLVEQLLRGRGGGDQGGPVAAPPPDAGADGSVSGVGSAPDGATGGGGQGGSPGVACGPLSFSSTIVLAPAAAGQNYVRCQTLGPEAGWRVVLSPAGDRLAARTGAGTLRLLATDTWTEIAQLGSPLGAIDAVAFSPDGATLATLSAEMGEVTLWSAHDGTLQRSFAGPAASGVDTTASALAFSSDGGQLATSLGTVIDLGTGATTSWLTGASQTFTRASNPENLGFSAAGGGIPLIRFLAGNGRLIVETDFQTGNSPTSTRLELRDPTTGAAVVLYNFYSRGLLGYAVSPDGRTVARATTAEAGAQGFAAGLALFDTTSGTELASDPSFAGTVLGFSRDGAQLFIETGTTVSAVGASDLHPVSQITVPAGVAFLGISPANELVGAVSGKTSWWNPATGAIVKTSSYSLAAVTWSGDGRFGAGTGDPAALFHFWRESDDGQLCGPPADLTSAPVLASLGPPGPAGENQTATSSDGSLTVSSAFVIHDHAANYDALGVKASA
ncbi:MAG TPA: WD40 repeat domain-containing protein, partial [Polyangia bacterium]|nr:WD40 repeat domain-containing protein [Polyangia bacterium]